MKKRKTCVHIIIRDKFTTGYINFFKKIDFGWKHVFITFNGEHDLKTIDNEDVIIVGSYKEIINRHNQLLNECDKIVVAAFFDQALYLLKMPQSYWDKTYIQFWGGDIYRFIIKKDKLIDRIKQKIVQSLVAKSIKKCAGVLTLVEKDYDAIENILKVHYKKHRVVQVPDDFYEVNHIDYKKIVDEVNYNGKKRILVGNSATIENQHLEVFNILKDKINENIEIIVPLSYGLPEYKKIVIDEGRELLNESFVPILDFMPREKYIGLLSTCDVAIFNNNRQQATGNIILMANLGKKIYMRDDTSMWSFFKRLDFIISSISELRNSTIEEIFSYTDYDRHQNYLALKHMEEDAINQWKEFLNS